MDRLSFRFFYWVYSLPYSPDFLVGGSLSMTGEFQLVVEVIPFPSRISDPSSLLRVLMWRVVCSADLLASCGGVGPVPRGSRLVVELQSLAEVQ